MPGRTTGAGDHLAFLITGITCILLFAVAPSTARDSTHRPVFEFRPGVVVDPAHGIVYLMAFRGGIEAIALSSGQPVWVTAEPAKPLLLKDGLLLAQGEGAEAPNILRLRVLDALDGRPVHSAEVPLPGEVRAMVEDEPGTTFRLTARDIQHRALVTWEFNQQVISGRAPLPEELARARHERGALRIDLKTGRAEILRTPPPGPPSGEEMPDPLRRLAESKSLPGPLWRADAVFAAAFRGRGAEKSRITLHRWDARTGIALPDVVLSEEGHTIRYPSADGRHLLVSRRTGSDPDYEWVIFSLETGQRAATLHHPSPGARFFLADGLLVHEVRPASGLVEGRAIEEPLALRVVDLASGRERWKRPLRDTAYRGPHPPHPSEPSGTRSSAHLRKEELCAMPAEKFR